MDDIDTWLGYIPMKDLENNQKILNRIGNDWYLIAIARSIGADFIITYDKDLISMKSELKNQDDIKVLTSEGLWDISSPTHSQASGCAEVPCRILRSLYDLFFSGISCALSISCLRRILPRSCFF